MSIVLKFTCSSNPIEASSSPMELQENGERVFKSAVEIILQRESTVPGKGKKPLFEGSQQEIYEYFQAVNEIQRSMLSHVSKDQSRASKYMGIATARLTEEFRIILISTKSSIETHWLTTTTSSFYSSSLSTAIVCKLQDDQQLNKESVHQLRTIAETMSSAGYLHVCIQVYVNVWKSFMDTTFQRLGIEHISIDSVKRFLWGALVLKIRQWIEAANCLRILFVKEKQLREQIFEGMADDETCFMEMFKHHAILLLNFAQVASSVISRRSPEKLLSILDLYNTLLDLLPDINAVFNSKSLESICIQADETLFHVAEAARGMLSEFENAVLHELMKVPDPQGTIHSLTGYVMNCMVRMASTYREILVELIVSKPSISSNGSDDIMICDMESVELDRHTPLALHFIWITVVLQFNLEGKSKCYEDASRAHLFMMNNVHYIVQKINGCTELREMIGDYFLEKLTEKVQQEASNYLRATWDKVLSQLDCKSLQAGWRLYFGDNTLKDRLRIFYAMFGSVHEAQAKWLVLDLQLRKELHLSILEKLIPFYRSFMDRLHEMYGKQSENYIKYSVEDLENAVYDLFKGHHVSKNDDLSKDHHVSKNDDLSKGHDVYKIDDPSNGHDVSKIADPFKGHDVSKKLSTSKLKWWKCGIIP